MTRSFALALGAALLFAPRVRGQSLEHRILNAARGTGESTVQLSFASRDGVCGDGARFLSDGLGNDDRLYVEGGDRGWRRGTDYSACIAGPVRLLVVTDNGRITRLRTYVGPQPQGTTDRQDADLGMVGVSDAVDFLAALAEQDGSRAAADAILPIVLADSVDPWPTLLRLARDERAPRNARNTADFWLARGAGSVLNVNQHDATDDDDVRAQAVFALSQQPRESAVPRLIEVVHSSTRPAVRAQALFWLGQTGDPRAVDLFEQILSRAGGTRRTGRGSRP